MITVFSAVDVEIVREGIAFRICKIKLYEMCFAHLWRELYCKAFHSSVFSAVKTAGFLPNYTTISIHHHCPDIQTMVIPGIVIHNLNIIVRRIPLDM